MRQLAGYILPGAAMLAFGVKWGVQVALEQMEQQQHSYATISSSEASSTSGWSRSKKKQRRGGDNRRSCSWRMRNVPAEGVIKLSITGLGIAASVAMAAPSTNASLQPVGDMLYASIYMFFALSGLADVLVHYCPLAVPPGMDRLVLALAFAIEGLMFHLHLAREAVLEQHVHFLLVVSIYSCAACCLIEAAACSPHPFLWRFARALFAVLHGSWFVHCAFLLHWDGTETIRDSVRKSVLDGTPEGAHEYSSALVWVSLAFAWHCAGALALLMALMFVCRCCCRRPRRPRDTSLPTGTSSMGVSAPGLTPPLPLPSCSRCLPPPQHPHFATHTHPHSLPHPLPHLHTHNHPILPPTPSPQ